MAGPLLPIVGAVGTAAAKAAIKKAARRKASTKAKARDTREIEKGPSEEAQNRLSVIMKELDKKNLDPKKRKVLEAREQNLIDMIQAGDDVFKSGGKINKKNKRGKIGDFGKGVSMKGSTINYGN